LAKPPPPEVLLLELDDELCELELLPPLAPLPLLVLVLLVAGFSATSSPHAQAVNATTPDSPVIQASLFIPTSRGANPWNIRTTERFDDRLVSQVLSRTSTQLWPPNPALTLRA
jgi:hypothetical protein